MNGCFARDDFVQTIEMADTLVVPRQKDHASAARSISRNVPFAMSRRCEYTKSTLGQADAGCLGCRHRSNVKEEK